MHMQRVVGTLSRCVTAVWELRPPPTRCSSSLTRCRAQLRFPRLKTCTSLPAEMEHLVRVRVRVKVRVGVGTRVKARVRVLGCQGEGQGEGEGEGEGEGQG